VNCKPFIPGLIMHISIALFILNSLTLSAQTSRAGKDERKVALVGKTAIKERDVSYKVQIEKAYGNERATREAALVSLINDAIEHEIAAIHGVTITREDLDSFKRHVNEQTKAPEILQKVKVIFGDDTDSYERIYLAPKIMNRKLHEFYSRSPEIHKKERDLIERAHGLVTAGKGFNEASQECGIKFSTFNLEEKEALLPPELRTYFPQSNTPMTDPLIPILDTLFPGEIYRNVIEDDYRYRIVKLIERNGETYSVEVIWVKKRPFDEWFRQEAANVRITIVDPDLRNTIKTKYPGLWWVQKSSKAYTSQND